ncbi:MAG: OadG family protein [Clostridia bacterium]|nr:OadG family protein [Clostridia bacterium]
MLSNLSMMPSALALTYETIELMWQTPLLGIGMVFAVLAILWGVLAIFKFVFAGKTPKEPKPVNVKPVEQTSVQTVAPAPVAQSNDAELVAIITAAVAAYMAEEGTDAYSGGFRVVSFKRVRGGRTWNTK